LMGIAGYVLLEVGAFLVEVSLTKPKFSKKGINADLLPDNVISAIDL
jgi:hypothetical protein